VRLFVAAYPPPDAVEDLSAVVSRLALATPPDGPGTSLRLAPPEQWHVTLAFLGDVADDAVSSAVQAVRAGTAEAARGWTDPLRLRIAGGGRFGRGRFTMVWAGLDGDVDALRGLADGVRRALRRARLPYDRKPLRPHLTLARPGDRLPADALAADLATLDAYAGPPWWPGEVNLMRSQLGPRPSYDVIDCAVLPAV
jgi:2'-5' RNA ligase